MAFLSHCDLVWLAMYPHYIMIINHKMEGFSLIKIPHQHPSFLRQGLNVALAHYIDYAGLKFIENCLPPKRWD